MSTNLQIYKYIEKMFYRYEAIKKAVWEARNDKPMPFGFESGHAHVSDTTANKAIALITPLRSVVINTDKDICPIRRPEDWIKVFDITYEHFMDTDIAKVMDMRYHCNYNYLMIASKLYISKSLVYDYRNKIVVYASLVACQLGLVKIYG